ncbi:MAG: GNAT family N-acetyltransferase [bacterium]
MVITRQANIPEDLDQVRGLLCEYLNWVERQLGALDIEVADVDAMMTRTLSNLDVYMPPEGRLLLAEYQSAPAGVIYLKRIRSDACELKRMYVSPSFRGLGIGQSLLDRAIDEAQIAKYSQIMLDSIEFMQQAQKLYLSHGFVKTDAYPESEMKTPLRDNLIYMCLDLGEKH